MKVTLINYTQNAEDLLIFTKQTRLMDCSSMEKIQSMTQEEKMKELAYMANTIPSSWEFVDYTFLVEGVSRACTHQMVRTRTASFAQQSLRVVDSCEYDYVKPDYTDVAKFPDVEKLVQADATIDAYNAWTRLTYKKLLELGFPVEDARGVLPTNIATNIVAKYNLRTFVDLAKSRTGGRTQGEYQKIMNAMVDEVLAVHPWADLFINPHGRNHFDEIEKFAHDNFACDLAKKGELLKIVDILRKG